MRKLATMTAVTVLTAAVGFGGPATAAINCQWATSSCSLPTVPACALPLPTAQMVLDGSLEPGDSFGLSNLESFSFVGAGLTFDETDMVEFSGQLSVFGSPFASLRFRTGPIINPPTPRIASFTPNSILFAAQSLGSPALRGNWGCEFIAGDPLPDGTISRSQGFYGSSPLGSSAVVLLIVGDNQMDIDPIDETTCSDIVDVLDAVVAGGTSLDCGTNEGREALAEFLVGSGKAANDGGFLPAGPSPIDTNLAAQKITLLLNLNLALILPVAEPVILGSQFINIDVVEDLVDSQPGNSFHPILTTGGKLGTCQDTDPADGICDIGSVVLSLVGEKVDQLNGTTVGEVLTAADTLILSDQDSISVNGVSLSRGEMTSILSLINGAFDKGVPSGFVVATE